MIKTWQLAKRTLWFCSTYFNSTTPSHKNSDDKIMQDFCEYLNKNSEIAYTEVGCYDIREDGYKWVGGIYCDNKLYGIANDMSACLKINMDNDRCDIIGNLSAGKFKWTGGCLWEGKVYGFPRTANTLLCIDVPSNTVREIELGLEYNAEHHYSGVCTPNGVIYQPPRNTNHILAIDLKNMRPQKIQIPHAKNGITFRYCDAVLHPNGLIYMLPERYGRILVFNPQNYQISFIGKIISPMVFGACVAGDGNIYGFSGYEKGILKIDVKQDKAEMIFTEIGIPGCYGTQMGANGRLYGIPGDGDYIFEYEVANKHANVIKHLEERGIAKCAGGGISKKGYIYCIPAHGNKIYILKPNKSVTIPNALIESNFLNGNY